MDGCREIEVQENIARNNGKFGIDIIRVIGGAMQRNAAVDNGQPAAEGGVFGKGLPKGGGSSSRAAGK
jgi:hypothetical protein